MRTHICLFMLLISIYCNAQDNLNVENSHIRLNQVGYLLEDSKMAIVMSKNKVKERYILVNTQNNREVQRFKAQKIEANSWGGKFKYHYQIDFSSIENEGTYYLVGEKSSSRSAIINISDSVYRNSPEYLLEFMRQQRCGYNPFLDMVCHKRDGRSFYGKIPDSTFVDVSGGWHDAGDQLKYLITSSYATGHMLMAYELYPDSFGDHYNSLGQLGSNGIPDVLDEAKWGLEWIIKLHTAEDQLIHQVADDRDHKGWKMPDSDNSDYGWGENSYRVAYFATGKPQGLREYKSQATGLANLAGRSSAALALGSKIWLKYLNDSVFSNKCKLTAESLYKLGKINEGFQQGNSYGAPYRYTEETWTDDMEWGAAELYKVTGNKIYLTDAKRYARMANTVSWMNLDSAAHYQYYPFINLGHYSLFELVDKSLQDTLINYYKNGIDYTYNRGKTNAYETGIPFIWCSNNLMTSLITQIILYEKMSGDRSYHEFMLKQRDWLLGRNPWGTSMFTGIPENGEYPLDIHTSIWALTHMEVRGGLVDGPIYYSIYNQLKGLALYNPPDEFADVQNDYVVYHDDMGDYSTNEPTMDGTAGSMIMMGYWSSAQHKQ